MKVFVFGNPELPADSLPLRLIAELGRRLPDVVFETVDPNEEWDVPERLVVIDSVVGLSAPRIFHGLKDFVDAPRLSMHDFDAFANLRLLEKIGRLKRIDIIGLPPEMDETEALESTVKLLRVAA